MVELLAQALLEESLTRYARLNLKSGEITHMLDWLPHLTSVFPEAVDLAIQMPKGPVAALPAIGRPKREQSMAEAS